MGANGDICVFTLRKGEAYKRVAAEAVVRFPVLKPAYIPELPQAIRALFPSGWQLVSWRKYYWDKKAAAAKSPKRARRQAKKITGRNAGKKENGHKISPEKINTSCAWKGDAEKCAKILESILCGLSAPTAQKDRYNIDVVGLATAYQTGQNPIDFLSRPIENERKPAILITPDVSGSTANFAEFTRGFGQILAKRFDVYYIENCNGDFEGLSGLPEVDLILYMGDGDYFFRGNFKENIDFPVLLWDNTPIVCLDKKYCNTGKIGIVKDVSTRGKRVWVNGVKFQNPEAYAPALELAKRYF